MSSTIKDSNASFSTILKFITVSLSKYRIYLLFMLLAPLASAILNPVMNHSLKIIIDQLNEQESVGKAFDLDDISSGLFLYILSPILIDSSWRLYYWCKTYSLPYIMSDLHRRGYNNIAEYSYRFFSETPSGLIAAKLNDLREGFYQVAIAFYEAILPRIGKIVISGYLLYQIHPTLAFYMFISSAAFVLVQFLLTQRMTKYSSHYASQKHNVTGIVNDIFSNIISILSFAGKKGEENTYNTHITELDRSAVRLMRYRMLIDITEGIFYLSLTIGFLLLLISYRKEGLISIGDFAFVAMTSMLVIEETFHLVKGLNDTVMHYGNLKSAISILYCDIEVRDQEGAHDLIINKANISFQGVQFTYNNRAASAFDKLSFEIKSGEKIGLIGLSGAGKSTIIKLLMRYFDPQGGAVFIGGQDIKNVTQHSLRQNIDLVPQEITLFNRTIMENIRYANSAASDEEVIQAAKLSHAHDFIIKLPDGYDTNVGERGSKLSGGQRQRIAIARALLRNAPILILDEPTSSLDAITEDKIQESLDHLMQDRGKTVIAIAHRLSTLKSMDAIIVLDHGKIVAKDTHEALGKSCELYNRFKRLQTY